MNTACVCVACNAEQAQGPLHKQGHRHSEEMIYVACALSLVSHTAGAAAVCVYDAVAAAAVAAAAGVVAARVRCAVEG